MEDQTQLLGIKRSGSILREGKCSQRTVYSGPSSCFSQITSGEIGILEREGTRASAETVAGLF